MQLGNYLLGIEITNLYFIVALSVEATRKIHASHKETLVLSQTLA